MCDLKEDEGAVVAVEDGVAAGLLPPGELHPVLVPAQPLPHSRHTCREIAAPLWLS